MNIVILSLLAITIVLSFFFYLLKKKDNTIQNWQKIYNETVHRLEKEITKLTALLDNADLACDELRDKYDYISSSREIIEEKIKEEYNKKEQELLYYAKAKNDAIDAAYQIKANDFQKLTNDIQSQSRLYQALLSQTKQLNNESNSREKATIHLTQEAKDDIEYIYSISSRFHHPDILYKLIWSEYVQKPLNEMLKDNFIGEVSGIYKINFITCV